MSKELSEKIDQTVADLINNEVELSNFVNDYFIQAERVQELEELKTHYMEQIQFLTHSWDRSIKQNKRYRKKLEHIANKPIEQGTWTTQGIDCVLTARQALEGDPDESS